MGKNVKIKAFADAGEFDGYLVEPESPNGAAVVLIQEIFGINDNIRQTAEDLANQGFTVCAPDIFWRVEPNIELDPSSEEQRARAMEINKNLDKVAALKDCVATMNYLRESHTKVGVVGYCLGGRLAYHMATKSNADCSVGYYGVGIETVLDQAADIKAPLMLHIPELDHMCPPEAREAIYEVLEPKADIALYTYEGVGHAFARHQGSAYDKASATLANERTYEFLKKSLL